MKKIKIATGIKRIEDSDHNSTMFRLRDVLSEHRNILITRLASDLGAYVDYKFKQRPSARQLEGIKENLYALKNSVIDLDRYTDIIDHFFNHDMTHIGNEPFFSEIDESISSSLNASQLMLVK